MHIVNQIRNPELATDNTLHVIGVVSNYAMFHSRYRLFREWYARMQATPNVKVYIVETALGDRQFECTEAGNPTQLQLRTNSEAWVKESMINCGVRYLLPKDWKYMAWIDTDVEFENENWAQGTLHALQSHQIVQPWQQCIDLGPNGNIMQTFQSFGWMHQVGVQKQRTSKDPYQYCHSGFAWACTRRFFEALPGKGLIDWMILGSADFNMAWGSIGDIIATIYGTRAPSIARRLKEWELAAVKQTSGHVGYVPGFLKHYFHGSKKKRFYETRDQILYRCHFDPDHDLGYDEQGLIRIFNNPQLEEGIRKYNRLRAEDSIDSV
jgi:hypothetical protein